MHYKHSSYGAPYTVDRAGNDYAVDSADAGEVVHVHDDAVLGNPSENGRVARLTVMQVAEDGLGAGSIGMDDAARFRITCKVVFHDLAESTWKKAAVKLVYNGMHFGFGRRDPSLAITVFGDRFAHTDTSCHFGRRTKEETLEWLRRIYLFQALR